VSYSFYDESYDEGGQFEGADVGLGLGGADGIQRAQFNDVLLQRQEAEEVGR